MELILAIVFLVVFILVMRALGAWMLRINDLIKLQTTTVNNLKALNDNLVLLIEVVESK